MINEYSNMKVLLNGYSGYAQIDGHNVLMTSFSLSMNENILQSSGVGKLYKQNSMNHVFSRYKMNAVRDYPGYEFSISVDANYDILNYVFTQIATRFDALIPIKFVDDASGIRYEFEQCLLTSFSLGVANNAAASVTLGFLVLQDEIEVKFCEKDYNHKAGRMAPGAKDTLGVSSYLAADGTGVLVGATLMPYWAWGIETIDQYGGYFKDEDLYDFTISYSQPVTLKHGCYGRSSDNAPAPIKIVIGVPEVKYDLTYIVANSTNVSDYSIPSNLVALSKREMTVKYRQTKAVEGGGEEKIEFGFKMTDCYPDSYSPQYASSGDVNKISVSGTVYGKIEYPIR